MTAAALLSHLRSLDVRLTLKAGRLVCDAPKGALTPELRAKLAEHKAEIIPLLAEISVETSAADAIPRVPRDGPLPLSSAQERLWFLEEMESVSLAGTYNIPAAVRLRGALRVAELHRGLNEIVRRHEVLRSTFRAVEGTARAEIAASLQIALPLTDLSSLPAGAREAEVERLRQAEATQRFDLSAGSPIRVQLLRLDTTDHVLLVTLHHIVCDGWSLGVFLRELAALYEAYRAGRPSSLEEPPIQYVDYARWQRDRLSGDALETQIDYWRTQLGGELPVLTLPTDRPRPSMQTYRGATHRTVLSNTLTGSLDELARGQGATPFMVLLAAFASLLSRWGGQEDVVVGTPIAGRTRSDLEALIGLFVNTLAMRVDLSGAPTFHGLLARVRETALGAFAHQEVPFEKLVEELAPRRDMSRPPLFQVMFVLQNSPLPEMRLGDVALSVMPDGGDTAKFDLTLEVERRADELITCWNYNTDLFDAATIKRMAAHFEILLHGIVAQPEARLSTLPSLPAAERSHILKTFNDTKRAYDTQWCLHELIERQVDRAPDATAVTFEGRSLTYRELDERANQLAHHLRTLGIGPETLVGICVERSLEMVIGLLGILKAGGAYVPLDPSYPADRLAYMLSDSAVPVLLTQDRLVPRLPGHAANVIRLDADWPQIARQPRTRPRSGVSPANLAYMIYTSGSTGRPKGAMNAHRGIVNRLLWMQEAYGLTAADRILQKTPFSFDVSVWEFFWPLLTGAALVVARPEGHKDSAYLVRLIREEGITTLHFVPSMLEVFLEERGAADCPSLRRVICSGEALSWELKEKFYNLQPAQQAAHSRPELHNLYGPTEAAVDVTYWPCSRPIDPHTVPIGYPIANTQIYILDRYLQPVPVGVSGELYIAGVNVGRGYWGRPELTAERFIPDPFSESPGARMYKTGDLARHLPDGAIEYLGRLDDQVKIRGFRIELGEIESRLRESPSIREAVVVAREAAGHEKQLVAYIVAQLGMRPDAAELRGFLKDRLPEYMVPAAFVELPSLPLSPNGKLDRRTLPAPDEAARLAGRHDRVAPRNPTEEVLAGVWSEVLDLREIGIEDDFFELGGHSLLATQVMSRVRQAFRVELPLRTLFEAPTIAGLARKIEDARGDDKGCSPAPIAPADRALPLPLSFAQERLWFLEEMESASLAGVYNIPVAARLTGVLRVDELRRSLNEIVRRHEVLRATFRGVEGKARAEVAPSFEVELPVTDLSSLSVEGREAEIERVRSSEALRAFDLSRGPLIRAQLLRLADAGHVLLVTMHHIVCDGWSLGVFLGELAALYEAYCAGSPSPLRDSPVQYVDYALWQRHRLTGEVLERQLDYWRTQLGPEPPVLELPTDRPRPSMQAYRGAMHRAVVPKALTESLDELARREGATPFMVLLGAFACLLSRWSGHEELVVGTPIAGRTRVELEGLIGLFVNTLALRIDLSGDPTFRELLHRVRETSLGAHAHQEVPFEKLVEELAPRRDLSRTPLFQVVFVLQNSPLPEMRLGDVALSVLPDDADTAKFDLTLEVERRDGAFAVCWNYNADLFDAATIERMAGHFEVLLRGIVAQPEARVSSLPVLTEPERRRVLDEWAGVTSDYPRDKTIQELFEAQTARAPDATALVFGDQRLSYRELNDRANQLAHLLRRLGVGPEVPVGICDERSIEMIVAVLAILKAGGAYVPLDPSYPRPRLAFMLADTRAPVVLTRQRLADCVAGCGTRVVCVDTERVAIADESRESFASSANADNLAYVIYTSGSTGTPKGTGVIHRNVVRLVKATNYAAFGPDEVSLLLAPLAFDASTLEIWGPLLNGGQLAIMPPQTPSLQELGDALQRHCVTTLWLTAGLFHQVVDESPGILRSVRQVLAGGDVLSVPHVRRVLAGRDDGRLINGYGPTENTTFTCCHPMTRTSQLGDSVPIGRPIANTKVYILDRRMRPVPVGVFGELYIGGDGLARGYLNQPELTAENFVPDSFGDRPGARLYRTGDQVRWRPDGTIEFRGRLDQQVKIRGFRIELGEIEAVLAQHPDVRETAVLVRDDGPGGKRLVAYVIAGRDGPITVGELRRFLQERLPDYMVPAAFVQMESFPLTVNGKLDRRALPAPDGARPELETRYVPPATPAEKTLARIWMELLRVEQVGIRDNFFELGGDSILSIQVVALAARAGLRLTAKQVFQCQTVAELAAVAGQTPAAEAEQGAVTGELPLTSVQRWFFDQDLPDPHHWNQSVLLELRVPLDCNALEQAMNALGLHHDALRLRFVREPSGWRQFLAAPEGSIPLRQCDLSSVPQDKQGQAIEREAAKLQAALDLARGPIVQTAHFDLGRGRPGRLLIVIHHLAVDGVSWRILLEDLQSAYEQARSGRDIVLPAKTASYKRWAQRLMEYAQSSAARGELEYWLAERPSGRLPVDHADGDNTESSRRTVSVTLSAEETRAILQDVPQAHRAQITDVLLTAVLQAFQRRMGVSALRIDLERHGREAVFEDLDLTRTVGWFTSIFPMVLQWPEQGTAATALQSMKEELRRVPNGGIGYGVLRYLGGVADAAARLRDRQAADVSFNYLGQFDQTLTASGLFVPASEGVGPEHNPQSRRSHLLDINALIVDGRLRIDWLYSENIHRRETIEGLSQSQVAALRSLIEDGRSSRGESVTSSDFPLAGLDEEELAKVARLLNGSAVG